MGNILIIQNADFSKVAVERVNNVLWYENYNESSDRSKTFSMRDGGLNIIGLNQSSLNGKKVIGIKLLVPENYSFSGTTELKVYKFNGSERIVIGSVPFADCVGKNEVSIACNETLFDDAHWLGVGSQPLLSTGVMPPICGSYTGGTTKQADNSSIGDSTFLIYCAIYVKDE